MTKQTILITGAAGRIGTVLTRHLTGRYQLHLMDVKPLSPSSNYPFTQADIALTYNDLVRLFDACLQAPEQLRYGVFHGISNNRWKRLDISDTRKVLGYRPEDDAFALAGLL